MSGAIDKNVVQRRFKRSLATYNDSALIQREMAEDLLDLFTTATLERQFATIVELGCGAGILTDMIANRFDFVQLELIDIVPECAKFHCNRPNTRFTAGDIEKIPLPDAELFLANAVFQWAIDPKRLFARIAKKLPDNGYLAFSTFGQDTLREISALTGKGLAYLGEAEIIALLETNDFEVIAGREELLTLEFDTPLEVLKHLKDTGVNSVGATEPWSRRRLEAFSRAYSEKFRLPNGKLPLSYHPIFIVAKKQGKI
ncbi:MAG: malonyl-ACP O-methyltransferase BioC [Victivallales bacterium]|jgi:malonyl-ACP O-methyltransferase BioC|nr:malonyl-ACP O-methyltransferase BioC [Victivallales bacterium]